MGQNIPGYTPFYVSRTDRLRACILARDMNATGILLQGPDSSSNKL